MPWFEVQVPIAGIALIEVNADCEKRAIEMALEKGFQQEDIQELDAYRILVRGNVFYGPCWKASAIQKDDSHNE